MRSFVPHWIDQMAREYIIHTPVEIERIRRAAKMAGEVREEIASYVRPGMSTKELDMIAGEIITSRGAKCAFLGYRGFPANICISVNDVVVHGIASNTEILQDGDIVSLDIGVDFQGGIGDTAKTVYVGSSPVPAETRKLMDVTASALEAGIRAAVGGNYIRDISAAVQKVAKENGIGIVRDFVGHGCGTRLHEPPEVPNYVTLGRGPRLQPGMVLAIEPMFNLGTGKVFVERDNWTTRTADGKISAHFEHMVLITNEQPEVLTRA